MAAAAVGGDVAAGGGDGESDWSVGKVLTKSAVLLEAVIIIVAMVAWQEEADHIHEWE